MVVCPHAEGIRAEVHGTLLSPLSFLNWTPVTLENSGGGVKVLSPSFPIALSYRLETSYGGTLSARCFPRALAGSSVLYRKCFPPEAISFLWWFSW